MSKRFLEVLCKGSLMSCTGVLLILAGCSMSALRDAGITAARDPWTWAPLAAAGLVTATDSDERISQWAKTETPVFGSQTAAQEASDSFRALASTSAWTTFAAARNWEDKNWMMDKGVNAAGNMVGLAASRNLTGVLKAATQRERPHHGPVHDSFPSAHATDAFAHASMGRYFADSLPLDDPWQTGAKFAMNTFAIATAWGRVEGGVHYPTDVLVGAAIANFCTRFFMTLATGNRPNGWRVLPRTDENGTVIIDINKPL